MYVDRSGMHCVLMSDNELFYVNWKHDRIYVIDIGGKDAGGEAQRPSGLRSVEISAEDEYVFEILVGTTDGQIFHASIEFDPDSARGLDIFEPFESVLELPNAKAILDLKVAKINYESIIIMAITESNLY
jgi:hypothetical protein